jgi:hypothetical protein
MNVQYTLPGCLYLLFHSSPIKLLWENGKAQPVTFKFFANGFNLEVNRAMERAAGYSNNQDNIAMFEISYNSTLSWFYFKIQIRDTLI